MIQYPLEFEVSGRATPGKAETWSANAKSHHILNLKLAVPPEFDGPGGGLSPEDVYALALQNCFVATFKVMAEKARVEFKVITTRGLLTVDRDENGTPWMASFRLEVRLDGATKKDAAERLLESASKQCLIINSVRTKCTFAFTVNASSTQPEA